MIVRLLELYLTVDTYIGYRRFTFEETINWIILHKSTIIATKSFWPKVVKERSALVLEVNYEVH